MAYRKGARRLSDILHQRAKAAAPKVNTHAGGRRYTSREKHSGQWWAAGNGVGAVITIRSYSVIVIALLITASPAPSAQSGEIPNLDVKQLCVGIASQSTDPLAGGYPKVDFDRCMSAERDDREELTKVWSTFSASDKIHCVAEVKMGGESSYTELITCLEMARDVRALRTEQQGSVDPKKRERR